MRNEIHKSWETRRRQAIERLVEALKQEAASASTDDDESINTAADAVTVAHIAARLGWEGGPLTIWRDKEARAMGRLVGLWKKYAAKGDDPDLAEELNVALDALAVAHIARTFEWASGPLKWDKQRAPRRNADEQAIRRSDVE
jgi:hypothetical protein